MLKPFLQKKNISFSWRVLFRSVFFLCQSIHCGRLYVYTWIQYLMFLFWRVAVLKSCYNSVESVVPQWPPDCDPENVISLTTMQRKGRVNGIMKAVNSLVQKAHTRSCSRTLILIWGQRQRDDDNVMYSCV